MTAPGAPARSLVAFADGACEPVNPGGTATFGVVVYEHERELASSFGVVADGPGATNNVAEFASASRALTLVRALGVPRGTHLTLHGDSQLWVRMLNGRGRPRTPDAPYVPHYEQARAALAQVREDGVEVRLAWVPRERNERADELSKLALALRPPRAVATEAAPAPRQAASPVLHFGRYAGLALDAVPTPYLLWFSGQEIRSASLRAAIWAELRARGQAGSAAGGRQPGIAPMGLRARPPASPSSEGGRG